tara:strand:- start:55 stop:564 length:510 start_codon:yes stop_codon:yes gene_type:complete
MSESFSKTKEYQRNYWKNRRSSESKKRLEQTNKQWRSENKEYLREYDRKRDKTPERIAYKKYISNKRHYERRSMCEARLGNACARCGTTKGPFQFDHIKPEDKEFTIAGKLRIKIDKLLKEVDKCQLLCGDCHLEKTFKEDLHVIIEKRNQTRKSNEQTNKETETPGEI